VGLVAETPVPAADSLGTKPRRQPMRHRNVQGVVWGIAAGAAVGGALVPDAGDGAFASPLVGTVAYGLLAGVVTMASSRARRWASTWLAGVALIGGAGWALAPAGVGFVLGLVSTRWADRDRITATLVGALGVQTLLRLPDIAFHGVPTVLAIMAILPVFISGYRNAHRNGRLATRLGVALGGAYLLLALVALGVATVLAMEDLDRGVDRARDGLDALRDGQQISAAEHFDASSQAFRRAERTLGGVWTAPARLVPGVSANHAAALEVARSGADVASSAATTATVAPYQDLKAEAGRIDLTVVAQMQPAVSDSAEVLRSASASAAAVGSPWLLAPLADALADYTDQLDEGLVEADLAEAGLRVAPPLLGAGGPRTYLVLFTTPAETRLQGGFVGSVGILRADNGRVELVEAGSVDNWSPRAGEPPRDFEGFDEWRRRYSRYNPGRFFQNLTAGPDFPTNAAVASQLVAQAWGDDIDGVLSVDPYALAALLELTGPVEVEDFGMMDADNAVDYLLRDQYIVFADETEERRELLVDASRATFDALTSRDLPGPRRIGEVLGPVVAQDRLMFWSPVDDEREFLDSLGLGGHFGPTDPDADFVSVRSANLNPNKIDIFLRRHIDYDVTYDRDTGEVDVAVRITLHNDSPAEGLPDYVIGHRDSGASNGSNFVSVSLYSPHLLTEATMDGESLPIETQTESGVRVYSAQVVVPPGGSEQVRFRLIGALPPKSPYTLDISAQPIVHDDTMTVTVSSAQRDWRVAAAEGLDTTSEQATGDLVLDVDQRISATLQRR
jgi:hypothetical protein